MSLSSHRSLEARVSSLTRNTPPAYDKMDPLSISLAVMTVGSLVTQTCTAFVRLRATCKAVPGRLHALSNEVSDFQVVLYEVVSAMKDRTSALGELGEDAKFLQILDRAKVDLEDIEKLVVTLVTACERVKIPLVRSQVWKKEQDRLHELQKGLNDCKCNLNLMLGASSQRDMLRVRLDIEAVHTIALNSAKADKAFRDDMISRIVGHQAGLQDAIARSQELVIHRIDTVERLLAVQLEQMEKDLPMPHDPPSVPPPAALTPQAYRRRHSSQDKFVRPKLQTPTSEGVAVRVTRSTYRCSSGCSCSCHVSRRSSTPPFVDRILGRLFVGYAGLPLVGPRCDWPSCRKSQAPRLSVEYWFPMSFCWGQILKFQLAYSPTQGPRMQLETLRRVSDSAPCINFALNGNIAGLKDLFSRGIASPRDVSATRGYSVLRWAVYGKQWETAEFLMIAGADPDYRPIAAFDNTPRNKACDFALQGALSTKAMNHLRCLTENSDWIEEQGFSILHKVVLRLSMLDLREQILLHPDFVDSVDALGRTSLTWAAARGDDESVATLLSFNADPNLLDIQLTGPVSYAAERDRAVCVRLLLEAGAAPDPALPPGIIVGTGLNCAARNATNPLVIKTLLDFGADIEARGVDGKTSLHHIARTDNLSFAMVFLDYGANVNATSLDGMTPLTTAIVNNSHRVLQLLLDRWFEYSSCPRLKGPHLLEFVARYGDLETISILTASHHFRANSDKTYAMGDFVDMIKQRGDTAEKLVFAFNNLIDIIQRDVQILQKSKESLMEAGLLSRHQSYSRTIEARPASESSSVEDAFEEALESLRADETFSGDDGAENETDIN